MRALILVEDFDRGAVLEAIAAHADVRVVGLSPMACWELEGAGIEHSIPEDYGAWSEVQDEGYQRWFIDMWIPALAAFSGAPREELILLLTPLRFMMEAFLRRAHQARWLLRAVKPDRIYYVLHRRKGHDPIDDDIYRKGGSLFHSVFGGFAPSMATRWVGELGVGGRWRQQLVGGLRGWRNWVRTAKALQWVGYGEVRFCFASVIPDMMRSVGRAGHGVAVLPEYESTKSLVMSDWPVWVLSGALMRLSEFTGFPLRLCECLMPQLDQFFCSFLPKVRDLRERYRIFFRPSGFYYIIFNRRNKPHLYAAHMAARDMGIKTVYVRHGWSADDAWENRYTRLGSFDYFIPLAQVDHEFYSAQAEELGVKCEVL